jgi:hypothetical protein
MDRFREGSANAIVLFNPPTPEVIHEIARREVNGALERHLLLTLVSNTPSKLRARMTDDGVNWKRLAAPP